MNKKDQSTPLKTAKLFTVSPITGSVSLRSVKRNNEAIGKVASAILNKDKNVPYCPKCMSARLGYDDQKHIFGCMNCDFIVDEPLDITQINELKAYIRQHGYELDEAHAQIDYSESIKKRVMSARVFGIVSLLFIPLFFYTLYKFKIFIALNTLLMVVLLLLFAATNGYRAWQMANNKFFAKDGKEQFNHYLTHNNWFAYPKHESYDDAVYSSDYNEADLDYDHHNATELDGYEPVNQDSQHTKL